MHSMARKFNPDSSSMNYRISSNFNPFTQNFIQENDHFILKPFYGKSKKQIINRTKFDFYTEHNCDLTPQFNPGEKSRVHFELEKIQNEAYHFRLERVHFGHENRNKYCYRVKTLNNFPLRLNGQYVFEAIICHLDRISLSGHELVFLSEDLSSRRLKVDNIKNYQNAYNLNLIKSDISIYIQGETGTGKTHLAHQIHEDSQRLGPLVHLNVSSFPQNLIESELFGYKKGAFTGANFDKMGAIELAKDGTLFVDEVDSLSLANQTKLLLFLDNKKFRAVGDLKEKFVETRLIFSSGQDLSRLVEQGKMRNDFYFRITSGHCLQLKSCFEDRSLINQFMDQFCFEHKVSLTPECRNLYLSLRWQGNLRQLKGHLKKKLIAANSHKIDLCQLDQNFKLDTVNLNAQVETRTLTEMKRQICQNRLAVYSGDVKLAAKSLGLSVRTMKKYCHETNRHHSPR